MRMQLWVNFKIAQLYPRLDGGVLKASGSGAVPAAAHACSNLMSSSSEHAESSPSGLIVRSCDKTNAEWLLSIKYFVMGGHSSAFAPSNWKKFGVVVGVSNSAIAMPAIAD
jgi:hypothetical protein